MKSEGMIRCSTTVKALPWLRLKIMPQAQDCSQLTASMCFKTDEWSNLLRKIVFELSAKPTWAEEGEITESMSIKPRLAILA